MADPVYGEFVTLRGLISLAGLQRGQLKTVVWNKQNEQLVVLGYAEIYTGTGAPPPALDPYATREWVQSQLSDVEVSDEDLAATVAAASATRTAVDARVRAVGDATYAPRVQIRVLDQATTIGSSTAAGLATPLTDRLTLRGIGHLTSLARGAWQLSHTAAAVGTRPVAVAAVDIPASGPVDVVPLNLPEANNTTVYFTVAGELAGVPGTLTSAAASSVWTFTRAANGTAVSVPEGSEFIPTTLAGHERDVVFLNPGKNSLTTGALLDWGVERIINMSESIADKFGGANGRVLFVGHFVNSGTAAVHDTRTRIKAFNDHFAAKYGPRFFELSGYLTGSQVWTDTGITPTQADLDEQALGNKPPSLSSDNEHLNSAGYIAVADRLIDRAFALGWIPAPPSPEWSVLAADNFDRADGALGTTPTGGLTWTNVTGNSSVLRIVSGVTALPVSGSSAFAMVDPGATDYRVSADMPLLGASASTRNIRLMARTQDSQNFYFLTPRQSASVEGIGLWKMVANAATLIGSAPNVPVAGDRLGLEVDGTTLRVYLNDVELLARTDSTYTTGPCGLYMSGSGQSTGSAWDDFTLEIKA